MRKISKAIAGAVSAAAATFGTTIADGDISLTDVGLIVGSAVVGFLGVYFAPANTTPSQSNQVTGIDTQN